MPPEAVLLHPFMAKPPHLLEQAGGMDNLRKQADMTQHIPSGPDGKCLIGKCRQQAMVYVDHAGFICEVHANRIWTKIELRDATKCDEQIPGAEAREYVRADARKKRAVAKRKPSAAGQIYFVLIDGLVKVGWTSKLADRIRAYGPTAVVLANYPGTRADEGTLHKQLAPARAHGREWYRDGAIIRMFVDEAIAKYGPPRFTSIEWTEPKQIVAGKRAMRYR